MQQSIIGKVVDTYQITAILGKGGMGVVYKAKDTTLDRDVALKMMDANLARDEEFLKRFKSEAKALAKLQNPNIVSVFALRETEIGFALVMEFVDGNTLADQIRLNGPLPVPRALHIFRQILGALGDAHRNNVIHRDIKPSNVMLTKDDVVKVTDFGLAKIQQVSSATVTMGTGGTLYYMSPEQIRGLANVDARGDIYSIGMTLYEALTGRVPFGNDLTDFDIRQMIVDGKIPPPERFNPDLPKELVQIITKSIHKDPNKRYQSCEEMWADLAKLQTGPMVEERRQVTAEPVRLPKYKKPPSPRRPLYITIGAGLALIAGLFVLRPLLMTPNATLSIVSDPPSSKVTINGKPMGATPLQNVAVDAGSVAIRIDKEGYYLKDTTLVLREGEVVPLRVSLVKVPTQQAQQSTGAQGEPAAQSAISEARPNENTPVESKPVPAEKKPATPVVRREPAMTTATLVLRAVPSGTVRIDGGASENLGGEASTFTVAAGERTILFEHPRYGTKRTSVRLDPGERKQLTCYFEAYISVSTSGDATWGLLVIDGKTTDVQTPIDGYPLGPGRHRITVAKMGFETVEGEKVVVVEPSFERRVERLSFTLKRK
jgi:serine/threonine protein kinase